MYPFINIAGCALSRKLLLLMLVSCIVQWLDLHFLYTDEPTLWFDGASKMIIFIAFIIVVREGRPRYVQGA